MLCGQWAFWRRHRHRSAEQFITELEYLVRQRGVRFVWLADENFAANPKAAKRILELIVARRLDVNLNVSGSVAFLPACG